MRALLVLLVACRGSSSAPAAGSSAGAPRDAAQTRAIACAPATAKVKLGVHDDQPLACWDDTCVRDGERHPKAERPSAWIHPAEVRMDHGVLSVCNDGCTALQSRVAEKIAGTDPAKVAATTDLELVVIDTTVWRDDHPMALIPPVELYGLQSTALPTRIVVAGTLLVATFDMHGQIYDRIGARLFVDLHTWDPGEVVQLDEHTFVITDRSAPRFGVFDTTTGRKLWGYDQLAGFAIADAVRLRDGAGAVLFDDAAGWWIATFTGEREIVALDHVPLCR